MKTLLTLFIFVLSLKSFSCENIRLDRVSNILNKVSNQGRIGNCYAYAAADVLNESLGDIVASPEDLSIINVLLGGSYESANPVSLINKVSCSLSPVELKSDEKKCLELRRYGYTSDEIERLSKIINKIQVAALPKPKPVILSKVYSYAKKQVPQQDLSQIVYAIIDSVLSRGKPVGLSICSSLLTREGFSTSLNEDYSFNSEKCKPGLRHAVSIVGSKKDKNSCKYLIKNSWGEDCEKYAKGLDCKKGNIWISKNKLLTGLNAFFYIP